MNDLYGHAKFTLLFRVTPDDSPAPGDHGTHIRQLKLIRDAKRLRDRDVFVIDDGYYNDTPTQRETVKQRVMALVKDLKTDFPCNRIFLFNWPGNPTRLGNLEGIKALMLDWEPDPYNYVYDPPNEWKWLFSTNVARIANQIGSPPPPIGTGTGMKGTGKAAGIFTPINSDVNGWDYGRLARDAHLDYQDVMTQKTCYLSTLANADDNFARRATDIIQQYRDAFNTPSANTASNAAMQISIDETLGDGERTFFVNSGKAAECTWGGYHAGGQGVGIGAFYIFNQNPASICYYLNQAILMDLRPAYPAPAPPADGRVAGCGPVPM